MPSQKRSASAPAILPTEKRRRLDHPNSSQPPLASSDIPRPSGHQERAAEPEKRKKENVEPKKDPETKEDVKAKKPEMKKPEAKKNVPSMPGASGKRRAPDPLAACFMSKKKRVIKKRTITDVPPPKCMALVKLVAPISLPSPRVPASKGQDDDLFGDDDYDSDAFRKEFGYEKKEKKFEPAPKGQSDEQGYFAFTGQRDEYRHTKYKSAYNSQFTNVFAAQPPPLSQEAEYIEFEMASTKFFASDADSESAPFPTIRSKRCSKKGCIHFKKLRICQHDIERVLKGCGERDEKKWAAMLKKEGRKWHTDRFVHRKEWEEQAKEMFQVIGALVDEKKAPVEFVEDPRE